MQSENEVKKRKLEINEYTTVEIQSCINTSVVFGNQKSLAELKISIERYGHRETDIVNYFKQRRYDLWIKLLSSEWFSVFLPYLNLRDIAKLDTAFCSSAIRPIWLKLINNHRLTVEFMNNRLVDEVTDWLVMKNIHPTELFFKYTGALDSHKAISDMTIFQLTQNSPKLKKLSVKNDAPLFKYFNVHEKLFSYTAAFCPE